MQVASGLLILMCSCAYKYAGRDLEASTSPCLDGTVVNIDYHSCNSMYFGSHQNEDVMKVRCVSSDEDNFWTRNTFYFVDSDSYVLNSSMREFCNDDHVNGYISDNPREHVRVQN